MSSAEKRKRLQVKVSANDGVWKPEGVHLLSVTSIDELLAYATRKLDLEWAARKVYRKDGRGVTTDGELYHGMEVVVSCGEEFKASNPRKKGKSGGGGNGGKAPSKAETAAGKEKGLKGDRDKPQRKGSKPLVPRV